MVCWSNVKVDNLLDTLRFGFEGIWNPRDKGTAISLCSSLANLLLLSALEHLLLCHRLWR